MTNEVKTAALQRVPQPRRSLTHRETYFHLRGPTPTNKKDEHGKTIYKPGNLPAKLANKYNGVTAFVREEKDKDGTSQGWMAAYTACSKQDHYCKAKGRAVAHRHYFESTYLKLYFSEKPTFEMIVAMLPIAIRR